MKKILKLSVVLLLFIMMSCTQNQRVKSFGGEATINLEKGQKLINATWKNEDLWLLTTDRKTSEKPKIYYFSEKSSFGMMEGTYKIVEK